MNEVHDWRPLSEIWLHDLPQSLPLHFRDRQSAITNAVLSGEVAVRGRPVSSGLLGEWGAFDRIEKKPGLAISVMENEGSGGGVRYVQVEADLAEVTQWIGENALPRMSGEQSRAGAIARYLKGQHPARPSSLTSKELSEDVARKFGRVSRTTLYKAGIIAWGPRSP